MKTIIIALNLILSEYKKYLENDPKLDADSKRIRKQAADELLKFYYVYRNKNIRKQYKELRKQKNQYDCLDAIADLYDIAIETVRNILWRRW